MLPVMQFGAGAPLPDLSFSNEETDCLLKRPEEEKSSRGRAILINFLCAKNPPTPRRGGAQKKVENQKSWTAQGRTT